VNATIQAVDTGDETIYVLRREGREPITAYWPQPLLEIEPGAVRVHSWQHDTGHRMAVFVAPDTSFFRRGGHDSLGITLKQKRAERKLLRERNEQLKLWRRQRPGRFLRTGRKHNKNAKLSEADIRAIQWRHYTGYESLRSICREMWEEKGFASDKSMLNTICDTLSSYGLRKRSRAEMTARSNRDRSMRLPGEDRNAFKKRRRRETGEIRGVVCAAVKTRYGKGRGERCQRPALEGSDYCVAHDPERAAWREETLRMARLSRDNQVH
jgi:hypothetical protein